MRESFLPAMPLLYAAWDKLLEHRPKSFLTLGNWIGGDRDGNPYVTADALRLALRRQAEAVLQFYLDQVHALGAELSIAVGLAPVDEELLALAEASRSEEHTSELQSLMRISYAVFCLKKKNSTHN